MKSYGHILYDKLVYEGLYTSIIKVLTRISNKDPYIIDDSFTGSITPIVVDSGKFKILLDNQFNSDINISDKSFRPLINMKTDSLRISDMFIGGLVSVQNIFMDYIDNYKNKYSNLTNEVLCLCGFDTYMDILIDNIMVASLYCDNVGSEDYDTNINTRYSDLNINEEIPTDNIEDFADEIEDMFVELTDISTESTDNTSEDLKKTKKFRDFMRRIVGKTMEIKERRDHIYMNISHFIHKINVGRILEYRKYLGKVDSLYKHYGHVTVKENTLNGDPVEILMNTCPKYLKYLVEGVSKIYYQYETCINKLFECKNYNDMVKVVNNYITYNVVKLPKDPEPDLVAKALVKDFRYKIGKLILTNNDVYGYTIESIVEKKYPPIDHVIVSLFVPTPHEKPRDIPVVGVFNSPESFQIMSSKMQDVIVEATKVCTSAFAKINVSENVKNMAGMIDDYKSKYMPKINAMDKLHGAVSNLTGGQDTVSNANNDKDIKLDLKKRIAVLGNFMTMFESFVPIFLYLSDAGVSVFNISKRIDDTCRRALQSMLREERESTDTRDNRDVYGDGSGRRSKGSVQEDKYHEFRVERDYNRLKDKGDSTDDSIKRQRELRNRVS